MKWYSPALCLAVFSVPIFAQQSDQQNLQQQQLTQQQQQLTVLQQQLAQQQQQLAQQQEQLKQQQEQLVQQQEQIAKQQEHLHQNELHTKQLEHEKSANQPATPRQTEAAKRAELKSWRADNPWYGSDYARTQFAMRYAKQLQEEQPDLVGRPFLDAISAKVRDKFGEAK